MLGCTASVCCDDMHACFFVSMEMTKTLITGIHPWLPPVATFLSKVIDGECLVVVDIYIQDAWSTIEATAPEGSAVTGKLFYFARNQLIKNKLIPVILL